MKRTPMYSKDEKQRHHFGVSKFMFLMTIILLTPSCASMLSKVIYPISISSTPSEARITITDKKGAVIYAGNTPATIKLKAGSGFFSQAQYQVRFEKPGYDTKIVPVMFKLDGWYWANILNGIGMLIIDPLTGAMFKLDTEFLNEILIKSMASVEKEELKIYTLAEIPSEWKQHLTKLDD